MEFTLAFGPKPEFSFSFKFFLSVLYLYRSMLLYIERTFLLSPICPLFLYYFFQQTRIEFSSVSIKICLSNRNTSQRIIKFQILIA